MLDCREHDGFALNRRCNGSDKGLKGPSRAGKNYTSSVSDGVILSVNTCKALSVEAHCPSLMFVHSFISAFMPRRDWLLRTLILNRAKRKEPAHLTRLVRTFGTAKTIRHNDREPPNHGVLIGFHLLKTLRQIYAHG